MSRCGNEPCWMHFQYADLYLVTKGLWKKTAAQQLVEFFKSRRVQAGFMAPQVNEFLTMNLNGL